MPACAINVYLCVRMSTAAMSVCGIHLCVNVSVYAKAPIGIDYGTHITFTTQ